jgi:hypothetical protein
LNPTVAHLLSAPTSAHRVVVAAGMALLGCSEKIGNALGDKPGGETIADHSRGLAVAIVGLWIMNLFTNVMQGPCRALINDVVHKDHLQTGNAVASAIMGTLRFIESALHSRINNVKSFCLAAAAIIGNVIGAQTTGLGEPFFVLLLIGAGLVLLCCIPTMIFAKEVPYKLPEGEKSKTIGQVFKDIGLGFKYAPRELLMVAGLYFLSWCAYSPLMVNLTDYVKSLFNSSNDPAFGLKMAFYAGAIFSAVQFLWSLIQPSTFPYRPAQLVAVLTFCLTAFSDYSFNQPQAGLFGLPVPCHCCLCFLIGAASMARCCYRRYRHRSDQLCRFQLDPIRFGFSSDCWR